MEEAGAAIEQMNGVALSDSQVLRVAKARERGGRFKILYSHSPCNINSYCTCTFPVTLTERIKLLIKVPQELCENKFLSFCIYM